MNTIDDLLDKILDDFKSQVNKDFSENANLYAIQTVSYHLIGNDKFIKCFLDEGITSSAYFLVLKVKFDLNDILLSDSYKVKFKEALLLFSEVLVKVACELKEQFDKNWKDADFSQFCLTIN